MVYESVRTSLWEGRLDANGHAGGLEGQDGADGSSNGAHIAWQGGWGARFVVRCVIDGRTIRQGSLAAGGPGRWRGGEEGVLSSYYVYNQ